MEADRVPGQVFVGLETRITGEFQKAEDSNMDPRY